MQQILEKNIFIEPLTVCHILFGDSFITTGSHNYWTLFDATEQGMFTYLTGSIRLMSGLTRIDANRGDRSLFNSWTSNPSSSGGKYALVRNAVSVSEPSTIWLFLTLIVSLMFFRIKS